MAVFLKRCWVFLTPPYDKKAKEKQGCNKMTEVKNKTIPCCPLVIYAFPSPGGALSHLCLRRQLLPQLLLSWVSQPHPSLWRFFLFLLQHLLFFPNPSLLVLYCLHSSFHTLIACISHRTPLANCIILMVFFIIVHCGKLMLHAAN